MNLNDIVAEIRGMGLPDGQYVVVGGGCLAARGLRETRDLDIVVMPGLFEALLERGWPLDPAYGQRWNRRRLKRGNIEVYPDMFLGETGASVDVEGLVRRAEVVRGIPFLPLRELRAFKADAGQEKDARDVALIDEFLARADGPASSAPDPSPSP